MITECPSCNRQFRIHAWQLSAAKGLVQCGFCGEQFNALDNLNDHPDPSSESRESGGIPRAKAPEEPQFDIPNEVEMDESEEGGMAEIEKLLEDVENAYDELQAKVEEDLDKEFEDLSGISSNQDDEIEAFESDGEPIIPNFNDADTRIRPGLDSDDLDIEALPDDLDDEFGPVEEYEIGDEDIPPELLEDEDQETPVQTRWIWITGIVLLLILATGQFIWFNRDQILTNYPGMKPYFNGFCERFGCELIRARDISTIVLVNRDVRDHPRLTDSLLVNATIENQAGRLQPYPQIRLTLFDTDGNITGYRTFKPEEYLDQGVDILAGMPAAIPVHIVLEVAGAREAAVSFEFDFL